MNEHNCGPQLEGKVLYERQKLVRSSSDYLLGPTIVAENLKVPENIASVLRLADAAGSKEVIFLTDEDFQSVPKIKKMARNCDALVEWKTESVTNFLNEDKRGDSHLVAIELTTHSKNLFDVQLPKNCTFAVGNERFGISSELLEDCSYAVHIPMYGVNGSMNVSHALAIALFEWRRQYSAINLSLSNESLSYSEKSTSSEAQEKSRILNQSVKLLQN